MNPTQTRTHDEQYRLTNLTLAGGSTLDQLVYTYDPAGNVDYLDDQLNSAYDRDYSYDVLNRLKWDSGVSAGNPTYTYDDNGNRLTRTAGTGFPAQTISYVAGKNRMSLYNSTAVSYDGMGNVTNTGNNLTATIEVNGRLLTATVPNSRRVTLLYNGLGEMARARTETASGNQWTTQYWEYASFAPDGRALGLIQENTSRTEWEWVWVDNLPVVQFQDSYNSSGTYTGTTVTYLHTDHLGTPRIGTSTAGAISWRYRSDAFGIATISGTHTVRLRLPGQIDLGTGGINYNYFRDYDPNLGRYLESDPIGLRGGLNSYVYTDDNPPRWTDPLGLVKCTCVGPPSGNVRDSRSKLKVCNYTCNCDCPAGRIQVSYPAGADSMAQCIGQNDPHWSQPGRGLTFSPFSFDTDSPLDRCFNPFKPPTKFMEEIEKKCKTCE